MSDYIYHHGIKGQKWGVRRYQNDDGTLTPAGKKRYYNKDGTLTIEGKKKYVQDNFLKNRKKLVELQQKHPGDIFTVDSDVVENLQNEIKRDKRLNNVTSITGSAIGVLGGSAVTMLLTGNVAAATVGSTIAITAANNGREQTNRYLDTYGETKLDELAINGYKELYGEEA